MADPSVFGFLGLLGFLSVLGVNLWLMWRHSPQLVAALGFADSRGQILHLQPGGEPNVVRLIPIARGTSTPPMQPVRLAA